ncbi:ankyrin repeat protein [Penicillium odoratum]|uniref:ankyrin repeat protein n=1 Tax=Penicillium odoratum TaxID=1167516 RepID=UPI002547BCEC|nr:ankyrin repeat protein [Penicillium odoratum]KAJ5745670.1 ankyrin repeat protein [Penicillium odoratum]
MLDERHPDLPKPASDPNTYTLGSIGKHNIVIACLPKGQIGNNQSATVASRMISTFPSIKFGLMVGIGGGIPPKVRLGDVVVSTPVGQFPGVVQWDLGKTKEGRFERTGSLNNPPTSLLTALTKLETDHELTGSKIPEYLDQLKEKWPRLANKYLRSDSLEDVLFKATYSHVAGRDVPLDGHEDEEDDEEEESCSFCDRAETVKRKPREMRVHFGLIASGNQVIKDAVFRDKLKRDLGGHILCVEKEAAGLMNNFPCLVIRGVCDYADSHKNKDWQEHAAAAAAGFAKELLEYVQPSDVDAERPVKDILSKVLDNMDRIGDDVETVRSRLDKREDLRVLNWLTPIEYGPQQSDFLKRRQPGTCQWLLDSKKYQTWLSLDKQTLFCPGIPGAGKTIQTAAVIDHLTTRFHSDRSVGIAYVFCSFRRQTEQRLDDLVASLLKQLSQHQPSLPDSLGDLYNKHIYRRTRPSFDELSKALCSAATFYSRVFILIDALDECQASDECRSRFISEIFTLQANCGANIFATSRFIPEITARFSQGTILEICASNEDVKRYLKGHIGQLPAFVERNQQLQEEITTKISCAVDGMFLLAQIYIGSLDDKPTPKAIKTALSQFQNQSHGIDEDRRVEVLSRAYDQAIHRINEQKTGFRELANKTLAWITNAQRPLTTSELQHALGVEVGEPELDKDNLPEIEDLVSVCAGLVTVDEESDIVRLVHYTAQEYFERTQKHWFPDAEIDITKACVSYLSFDIFESGGCRTFDELEERMLLNKLYSYAAQNWGNHALKASVRCPEAILFLKSKAKVAAAGQPLIYTFGSMYDTMINTEMRGLHLAALFGVEQAIEALFQNSVEADTKNAASQNESSDDLECKDNLDGQTPLLWAAWDGHEAVVELLVEKGVDLESKDNCDRTPLAWAAEWGREAVVRLLLEKGTDFESKDNVGQTPLAVAAEWGKEAVVRLLLERGADLEFKDTFRGQTPLAWAVRNGHEAVVRLLIEKGADLESEDNFQQTPLALAAERGREAVVRLLERGATRI